MTSITFDTHGFVKRLTNAGMPEKQAEVLADCFSQESVTKDYLDLRMKELEQRLIIRLGGMMITGMVTSVAVVAALVKLL